MLPGLKIIQIFGFVNTYKFATRYKLNNDFTLRCSISTGFRAPSLQQTNFSNTNTNIIAGQLVYAKLSPNYGPITKAAQIPQLKQEVSVNASLGFSWKPISKVTVTVDGYLVKLKNLPTKKHPDKPNALYNMVIFYLSQPLTQST